MGCATCGGSRKTSSSVNASNMQNIENSSEDNPDGSCFSYYTKWSDVDKNVTKLYNRIYPGQDEASVEERKRYLEMNGFLRGVITNLKHRCPTEDELGKFDIYKEFVDAKIFKYFGNGNSES